MRVFAEYMTTLPVINTHSHHLPPWQRPVRLPEHLANSYVGWRELAFDTPEARAISFGQLRAHAPFVWWAKGLQAAWDMEQPLTAASWAAYEDKATTLHQDEGFDRQLLARCNYERVLLDAYNNPGYDNADNLYSPVLRVNSFLYGYNSIAKDHNNNNPFQLYSLEVDTLEDYIEAMERVVLQKQRSGCVALKAALPYDRGLDMDTVDMETARGVFGRRDVTPAEEKAFGDFIFGELCRIAAETQLPMQIHTGLGMLYKSNPMQLLGVINRFSDTRFVLFHGGFPWTDEMPGLLFNHNNVYADLCWLPQLSPTAAVQFVRVALEAGLSDRITWGCDTWTAEESMGALMAGRWVVAKALDAMVEDGYLGEADACAVARMIMADNARGLYGL